MSNKKSTQNRTKEQLGMLVLAIITFLMGIGGFIWSYYTNYHTNLMTVAATFSVVPLLLWLEMSSPDTDDKNEEPTKTAVEDDDMEVQ